jgi:putative transcriptional regulator
MTKEAFATIKAGLEDAIAYSRGDKTKAKVWMPKVETVDVKAVRERLGLSQNEFSTVFAVGLDALQNWEQGRRRPTGPARVLLQIIDREPAAVSRALLKKRAIVAYRRPTVHGLRTKSAHLRRHASR